MSGQPAERSIDTDVSRRIDTTVAHPARRYDYWLGGKDNFAADRESGDAIAAAFPTVRLWAVENRRFLRRAVTYLAAEAGIRQFLDLGTGIPASDNTHEIAQAIAPDSRVVYVDNDPIVLVHARALLTSTAEGSTAYLEADFHEPERIIKHPDLAQVLDLSQPVALMLIALLHFFPDEVRPQETVARLVDALPSGSYLAISHITTDFIPPEHAQEAQRLGVPRTKAEFARFFDGMELVEPGIAPICDWRAEDEEPPRPTAADISCYGAVGRIR